MKLSVKNGYFAYKKGSMLLNNINADARDGEIVAVLGPNGAGKTTFLRCLMGFLRWSKGESTIDKENIGAMTSAAFGGGWPMFPRQREEPRLYGRGDDPVGKKQQVRYVCSAGGEGCTESA